MPSLHDIITKGSVDRSVSIHVMDSTDGTPETAFAYNTSGIDLWYRREGAARVAITEVTLAALTTAHTDGGVLHISDGDVRVDLPDAAFATGANYVDFGGTATGMIVVGGRVRLVDFSLEDAVRGTTGTAVPNAAAGASGGLLISGSNAGTTTLGALTVTGATTLTGNVAAAAGITITQSTTNGHGIVTTGNGTGAGLRVVGGATGNGLAAVGGSTSGDAIVTSATSGHGATFAGGGTTKHGVNAVGGATTSAGIAATGGSTSGDGILIAATSGHGIVAAGTGTTKHGIHATGGSTTSHGINAVGGGVGHGILATSGGGSTGDGIRAVAASTNGHGVNTAGVGTGAGLIATGGATGQGVSMVGGSTSGLGLGISYTAPVGPCAELGIAESGTLQSATATTAVLRSATSFSDDNVIGMTISITGGTGTGQSRLITDWVSSTDTATVETWITTPDNTSLYEVYRTAPGSSGSGLDAAGVRAAVGLASANLDTQLGAIDDFLDTEVAAIKTKTDFLPSATAGAAGGLFIAGTNAATSITTALTANITGNLSGSVGSATVVNGLAANVITAAATATDFTTEIQTGLATAANLATVAGYLDTEIAAIQTAVVTTIPAALTVIDDFLDTEIAAIKAKTDQLTFTKTNEIDANVQSLNGVTLTGDGQPGTEFGV